MDEVGIYCEFFSFFHLKYLYLYFIDQKIPPLVKNHPFYYKIIYNCYICIGYAYTCDFWSFLILFGSSFFLLPFQHWTIFPYLKIFSYVHTYWIRIYLVEWNIMNPSGPSGLVPRSEGLHFWSICIRFIKENLNI